MSPSHTLLFLFNIFFLPKLHIIVWNGYGKSSERINIYNSTDLKTLARLCPLKFSGQGSRWCRNCRIPLPWLFRCSDGWPSFPTSCTQPWHFRWQGCTRSTWPQSSAQHESDTRWQCTSSSRPKLERSVKKALQKEILITEVTSFTKSLVSVWRDPSPLSKHLKSDRWEVPYINYLLSWTATVVCCSAGI